MSDLVDRLRQAAPAGDQERANLLLEAAAEIERLMTENDKLGRELKRKEDGIDMMIAKLEGRKS